MVLLRLKELMIYHVIHEQEQYFFTSYSYNKRMRALGATHEINPLYDVIHD